MAEKKTEIEVKREPAREVGTPAHDWEPIQSLRHQPHVPPASRVGQCGPSASVLAG